MRHDLRKRLADSIEAAVGLADGLVEIEIVGSGRSASAAGSAVDAGADGQPQVARHATGAKGARAAAAQIVPDRKSTRLNSSHSQISYAVFCLKKKKTDYI